MPYLPSPLAGEGYTELQQQRVGEGVSSKESSCEEAPSPIIARGNYIHALSRKGRGQMRHRRGRAKPSCGLNLAPMRESGDLYAVSSRQGKRHGTIATERVMGPRFRESGDDRG